GCFGSFGCFTWTVSSRTASVTASGASIGARLAAALTGPGAEEVLDVYEAERLPVAVEVVADTARRYDRVVSAVRTPGVGTEAGLD
ncbi:hypothetical protein ACWDA9_34290, partial [Streptomyces sp. NPDC001193]